MRPAPRRRGAGERGDRSGPLERPPAARLLPVRGRVARPWRAGRLTWLALCLAALSACGGGGNGVSGGGTTAGSGTGGGSSPDGTIAVSGVVTFDLVPAVPGIGLDYAHVVPAPARGVTVQALDAASHVLASTATDATGHYTLALAPGTDVLLRARAEMLSTTAPTSDVMVVDNTRSDAVYALESARFTTGNSAETQDLHAASGWDGSAYSGERAAAPFAILDVIYAAMRFVSASAPVTDFPKLVVHWSPNNTPSNGTGGGPDPTTGDIGTSFFNPAEGMFLLGAADSDTDEYDRHVIAHEFGHYLENAFWRSDNIGGPHAHGDQLDMRTAFSEGWGNAFSAMATGVSEYVDTMGPGQAQDFSFDVEGEPGNFGQTTNPHPGWFSEQSVDEILYDLYDSVQDTPQDTLALGFGPLYAALVNHVKGAVGLTSLFPLVHGLETDLPARAAEIDALIKAQRIAPITDDYGAGRTNAGQPTDGSTAEEDGVLPVYKDLQVGGPAVNVCSSDAYSGGTGSVNKLGSRAFVKFTLPAAGTYSITAATTLMPIDQYADPDMVLHRGAQTWVSEGEPTQACTPGNPAACTEQLSTSLAAGDYALEVYEWTNTQDRDSKTPPIGLTCFDVTVAAQ